MVSIYWIQVSSTPTQKENTDIFSIASVLYATLTGHWPYRGSGPFTTEQEMEEYRQKVDGLFEQRKFPDFGGQVIMGY